MIRRPDIAVDASVGIAVRITPSADTFLSPQREGVSGTSQYLESGVLSASTSHGEGLGLALTVDARFERRGRAFQSQYSWPETLPTKG